MGVTTATAEAWVDSFFRRYRSRTKGVEWPASGTEFWRSWAEALAVGRVTEAEAEATSLATAKSGARTPADHRSAIRTEILARRRMVRPEGMAREMGALRDLARELELVEMAQVMLNRLAWAQLPIDDRRRIWGEAGAARPVNRIRYFRERSAWEIAGFPSPISQARTPGEAAEIVAGLRDEFGEGFDPTPTPTPAPTPEDGDGSDHQGERD